MEGITATLFSYVDWVSEQVVAAYEEEREQWLATHNSIRVVRVREVLTARTPIDVDEASEAIRYPLRWHHLALVMWYPSEVDADETGSPAKPGEATRRRHQCVRRSAVHPHGPQKRVGVAPVPVGSRPTRWSRFGVYCGSALMRRVSPSVRQPPGWRDSASHTSGRRRPHCGSGARGSAHRRCSRDRSRAVSGGVAGQQH